MRDPLATQYQKAALECVEAQARTREARAAKDTARNSGNEGKYKEALSDHHDALEAERLAEEAAKRLMRRWLF